MNTRLRFNGSVWSISVVLLAVSVSGCIGQQPTDGDSGKSGGGGTAHVEMIDLKFTPENLTVAPGTMVVFTNHDAVQHTVTPTDRALWGSDGSGDDVGKWLTTGQSWSFTFTKTGTFQYFCIPHAGKNSTGVWRGMVGSIIVSHSASASTGSSSSSGKAVPATTVVPSPIAPARARAGADGVVHLALETREVDGKLADGVGYTFWTFNGTVPGPMLRIGVNDTVELTLKNSADSTMPHSIDLHAVTGPGGGAAVTQLSPGASASFTFKALNPGLYVYHCASAHIPSHVANGMYGLILVEPDGGLPPVDREFYVVQGEFYTDGALGAKGFQGFSLSKLLDEEPEYFLMNGMVGALTGSGALKANVNETVRIYFGVGGFVPSSFHVIGEIFDRIYPEGGTPPVANVQTTLVPAGGATIVEFKVEVPGTYLLVDHWLTHAIDRGAAGHLVVTGDEDREVFSGTSTGAGSGH